MNDNDLIDELREGMRRHTAHTEVPDGFADQARRTARRRSGRRVAVAGAPLLAAAGVVTVLGASGGSPSSTPHTPSVTVGGQHAHDTAYIVSRVQANVAEAGKGGTAIHGYLDGNSTESTNGTLTLGKQYQEGYEYTAPDGTQFVRETFYQNDGNPRLIMVTKLSPDGALTKTLINPLNHSYSQAQFSGIPADKASVPDLSSSASEVQQALKSGRVTQIGTTTVNGTPAIALLVKFTEPADATPSQLTLYVNAQTYQPLRTATTILVPHDQNIAVADWIPATPDNIAQAENSSIPAGYTKVAADNANR